MQLTLVLGVAAVLLAAGPIEATGATVLLNPTQDNSIYEGSAGNSNGIGGSLFSGRTASSLNRRALLSFDIAGSVPPNAVVSGATLTLTVNLAAASASGSDVYGLHRLNTSWGEAGSSAPGGGGSGAAAQTGDTTWSHRFWNTIAWTTQGGDFAASASVSQAVPTTGSVVFTLPPSDVQDMLDDPSSNFGWILVGNEALSRTTRRFDSREGTTPPVLQVDYVSAPEPGPFGPGGVLNTNAPSDSGNDFAGVIATDGGGTWVAAWSSDDTLGGTIGSDSDMLFARSTNQGSTWSAPAALNSNAASDSGSDGGGPLVASGTGTWIAAWQSKDDLGGTIGTDSDILFARSTDGGNTWSAPAALNSIAVGDTDEDFDVSLATDGAGTWVATWYGGELFGPDILTARSTDDGLTWAAPSLLHSSSEVSLDASIATDGAGLWLVVWASDDDLGATNGTGDDIFVSRSSDSGVSWTAPVTLNSSAPLAGFHRAPSIATDDIGTWLVTWAAFDAGTGKRDILVSRSTDGGLSWSAESPLSPAANGFDDSGPHVTTDGGGLWLTVWTSKDPLGGTVGTDSDIFIARSADSGVTWTPPTALNSNAASDTGFEAPFSAPSTDGAGSWLFPWSSPDDLGGSVGSDNDMFVSIATPCGNTVLDAGEQCDDGNIDIGDCCSATCQFEASGVPGSICAAGSVCDGAGGCRGAEPVADAVVTPTTCVATGNVDLDGSGSFDEDPARNILLYEWDYTSDGTFDLATGSSVTNVSCSVFGLGAVTVTLRVTNDGSPALSDLDTAQVTVNGPNQAPVADAGGPYNCVVGQTITLDGSNSSDSDGTIVSYQWDTDNDGQFDNGTGVTILLDCTPFTLGGHTVGLRVVDDGGASGADTASLTVTACGPDGTSCDDGNACTQTDTCQSGVCVGSFFCDDSNACTVDSCNPGSGCVFTPEPDGNPCNDGNACTLTDTCQSGVCQGSGTTCGDGLLDGACEQCDDGNTTPGDCCSATCTTEPGPVCATEKLASGVSGEHFGATVAGGSLHVAATNATVGGFGGAGRVYRYDSAADLECVLESPTPGANASFGEQIVVIGSEVLVAAPNDDVGGTDRGSVYRFSTTPPCAFIARIDGDENGERFGRALAVVGTTLVVGAEQNDTGISNAGKVYLIDPTTGGIVKEIVNPTPAAAIGKPGEFFGQSLAVSGTDLLVGAPFDSDDSGGAGAAYLYDTTGSPPTLLKTFVPPTPANGDFFGVGDGLAFLGTNVLVGAQRDDLTAPEGGAVYLFDRTTGAVLQTYERPTPLANALFGTPVRAVGGAVLVGARTDGVNDGEAYLFDGTTGQVIESFTNPGTTTLGGNTGGFGIDGDVFGGRLAIGAPWNDEIATDAGAVYLFDYCGNGVVNTGEQCDDGNNTAGDCCSATCQFETGSCDDGDACTTADTCSAGTCVGGPPLACDDANVCTSDTCNPGSGCVFNNEPVGTPCRGVAGACDVAETCDGLGICPADAKSTAECRAAVGSCDVAESCDGVSNDCPADGFLGAGTECRAVGDLCDVAEQCTGTSANCPADGVAASGVECRAAAGTCDVAETCDGGSASCPADGFVGAGTECRAAAGVCDLAEQCTGSGAACPADGKSTAECRADAGDCDVAESCDGVGNDCPADAVEPDGTSCNDGDACSPTDECQAGVCQGVTTTCADGVLNAACGEQCDDGNTTPGDCCSATCQAEPGAVCPVQGIAVQAGDRLGVRVAAVGTGFVAGAPGTDVGGQSDAGAAYLFDANGVLLCSFDNPTPLAGEQFGLTVAAYGSDVLVGTPLEDSAGPDRGAVYLFDGTTCSLLNTFTGTADGDQFGKSVVTVGADILIGAERVDAGATDAGEAYLIDAVTGAVLQTFVNPTPQLGPTTGEFFGHAVATDGTTVLISANFDNNNGTDAGAAYLFDATTGALLQTIENPAPSTRDNFGQAVEYFGSDLVVTAQFDDDVLSDAGRAFRFDRTTGALLQTYVQPTPEIGDFLGSAMASLGGAVLIGMRTDSLDTGEAHLFDGLTGQHVQTFLNPGTSSAGEAESFGNAVALLAGTSRVVVGAPGNDTQGTDSGAVYLFDYCGNGIVSTLEQCDDGNTADGDCCSATCTIEAAGTACRAAGDLCDAVETCDGVTPTCPADGVVGAGTECRAVAGACDVAETCDGASAACPSDGVVSVGTECRASAGACDLAEVCDGAAATCPVDAKSTAECRAAADLCDVPESCDGVGDNCPADGFAASGTECRAVAGACDVAETCDGVSVACPGDAKSTAECRTAVGLCDVAESCDGVGNNCPADGFAVSGTECRAAAGDCDVAEQCTGSNQFCPPNVKSTAECRAISGLCDVAESCDGVGDDCPVDGFVASGTECRAAAGVCDVADTCTGSGAACPADAKSTAQCRAAADVCDVAESCDGVGNDCPADGFVVAGTECRAAAGACDLAESCTGSGAACPADAKFTGFCRGTGGQACDVAEVCDGVGDDCPPDGFTPAGTECRASAGDCDAAETCTGTAPTCPADGVEPNGTVCDDANACTTGETCFGGLCTNATGFVCPTSKCQQTILKEASKLVKGRAKTLQKCEEAKVKGKLSAATVCTSEAKTALKLSKASGKFEAKVDKACGGADKVCGFDTTDETGGQLDLGWFPDCPNIEGGACAQPIGNADCTGIAECIDCMNQTAVDQAIALYYATLVPTDPVLEKDLHKCQLTIGKETAKYLVAKEKTLAKCWAARLKGKHSGECPNLAGNPVTEKDPVKAGEKIAKAEAKLIAKLCKACGGADADCDDVVPPVNPGTPVLGGTGGTGLDADFTPAQIGIIACPDVTVPFGGPTCHNPSMTTLAELVHCVDCVTEFKVDCLERAQSPEFPPYPLECQS